MKALWWFKDNQIAGMARPGFNHSQWFDMPFDDADNYFVELRKNSEVMIVKVDMAGNVAFFKSIK